MTHIKLITAFIPRSNPEYLWYAARDSKHQPIERKSVQKKLRRAADTLLGSLVLPDALPPLDLRDSVVRVYKRGRIHAKTKTRRIRMGTESIRSHHLLPEVGLAGG